MTRNGLSVIFISHKLREVLAFSNRIAVLRHGEKVGEISSKEADERKIARLMVGEDTKISSRKKIKVGEPVLELNNLTISGSSKRESISNINLSVNKHEILGGSVPQDNPFKNRGELAKTFWTTGHRNALGLAFDQKNQLWANEMGPRHGDELNLIVPGSNYGWPLVSEGNHYNGAVIPPHDTRPEFTSPVAYWVPTLAPSGLTFYFGKRFLLLFFITCQAFIFLAASPFTSDPPDTLATIAIIGIDAVDAGWSVLIFSILMALCTSNTSATNFGIFMGFGNISMLIGNNIAPLVLGSGDYSFAFLVAALTLIPCWLTGYYLTRS